MKSKLEFYSSFPFLMVPDNQRLGEDEKALKER